MGMATSSELRGQDRPLNSELVAVSFLLALAFGCLDTDLFIIFLQCCKVLACLRELAFFHSFPNVPVNERALAVHQVKLVIDARKDLSDGRGITNHAHGAHDFSKVATRYHGGRLVVDATLETRGTPIAH